MRRTIIALAAVLMTLQACKEKTASNKIEIKGTVKNIETAMAQYPQMFSSDSLKVILFEIPFGSEGQPVLLDSAYISKSQPQFTLSAQTVKQSLYDVTIENGPMMPLINDNDRIELTVDLGNRERYYTVSGSAASKKLCDFIFGYTDFSAPAGSAFKTLDSLKATGASDSSVLAATENKNNSVDKLNSYLIKTINNADNPLVAAFTLGMASRTFSAAEYDSMLTQVIAKYPSDPNLQYLKSQLKTAEQQPQTAQQLWVGKQAPEMSMPDTAGNEISLSSFKGKFVLVDFWASWCGPCRMENPNVVKAYNNFKNKNFTVLGVSLDKEKEPWLEAIAKDQLNWTHISDLAFWNSRSVELFGFQGIPYNVLLNPDGLVIAENLRGEELEKKLKEVLQ